MATFAVLTYVGNLQYYKNGFRPVSWQQHSALDGIGTMQKYGKCWESMRNVIKAEKVLKCAEGDKEFKSGLKTESVQK